MTLRRIALGLAVAALVVVALLVLVAAVLERVPPPAPQHDDAPVAGSAAGQAGGGVPASWVRVGVGQVSYAVPPAWSRRPAAERVAYREDGAVIVSGRGQALLSARGCPVAWAVLADGVRSTNPAGVVEATALAWARGYAGLPVGAGLRASRAVPADGGVAWRSRVDVDLGDGTDCAGRRAELTAVARPSGAEVVTLVVARYLDVPGGPSDAAYDGVVGSLAVE